MNFSLAQGCICSHALKRRSRNTRGDTGTVRPSAGWGSAGPRRPQAGVHMFRQEFIDDEIRERNTEFAADGKALAHERLGNERPAVNFGKSHRSHLTRGKEALGQITLNLADDMPEIAPARGTLPFDDLALALVAEVSVLQQGVDMGFSSVARGTKRRVAGRCVTCRNSDGPRSQRMPDIEVGVAQTFSNKRTQL